MRQDDQSNLEIEENSVLDFQSMNKKNEELNNQAKQDPITNIEDLNTATDSSFKQLSRFSPDENQHIICLGIQLSKNHPVLNNFAFHKEMKDKIKGLAIDVGQPLEVSHHNHNS